jgi:hypothetical protein
MVLPTGQGMARHAPAFTQIVNMVLPTGQGTTRHAPAFAAQIRKKFMFMFI